MIIVALSLLAIIAIAIAYQDYTQRQVYLFLLLLLVITAGFLQYHQHLFWEIFAIETGTNLILVSLMTIGIWAYFRILRKIELRTAIGKGDLFVFLAYTVAFDTKSFVIHFTISLIASLIIHLILKKQYKLHETVPLAGYMSVYLGLQKIISNLSLWL